MNIFYNISNFFYFLKLRIFRYYLVNNIITAMDNHNYSPSNSSSKRFQRNFKDSYRQNIFEYYHKNHLLNLNLLNLIEAIHAEGEHDLINKLDKFVSGFSYVDNSSSFCEPMIRLNIQSNSVLLPQEQFALLSAEVEISNLKLSRKIKICCNIISRSNIRLKLLEAIRIIENDIKSIDNKKLSFD